ncbi:unnamed protein product, partial [Brenthis ino]
MVFATLFQTDCRVNFGRSLRLTAPAQKRVSGAYIIHSKAARRLARSPAARLGAPTCDCLSAGCFCEESKRGSVKRAVNKMPQRATSSSSLMRPFVVLALPGMYLLYKYNQYRQQQMETARRRVTERELMHLNTKIVKNVSYHTSIRDKLPR